MYTTYSAFNKVVMRQEEQNKVLERIEELEKNKNREQRGEKTLKTNVESNSVLG